MSKNFFSEDIGLEPKVEFADTEGKLFSKPVLAMKNGSPVLIYDVEAIRQWIVKFVNTEKGVYSIYDGTDFGCRLKSLFGKKLTGYGYEEAELMRDFEEGLPLCPAINKLTNFQITKSGKHLNIKIEVELYNNTTLEMYLEKIYKIGGFDVTVR